MLDSSRGGIKALQTVFRAESDRHAETRRQPVTRILRGSSPPDLRKENRLPDHCTSRPALLVLLLMLGFAPQLMFGQQDPPVDQDPTAVRGTNPPEPAHKRIFGIIPNYRTYPSLTNYVPLTSRQKFKIATQDSFDRGNVLLAAIFAGEGQLTNANPTFGQGVAGYASYFGTSYADIVIGNYFTEAIYPSLLHQDPRYFRRGTGGMWSRVGYAVGQIFVTHTDSGRRQFNFSEFAGNATAAAISNAYYPDRRDVGDNVSKFGLQIGIDCASNVLKEFWPDIYKKLNRKRRSGQP